MSCDIILIMNISITQALFAKKIRFLLTNIKKIDVKLTAHNISLIVINVIYSYII